MKSAFLTCALALMALNPCFAQLLPGRQAQTGTAFDLAKITDPNQLLTKLEQFKAEKSLPKQAEVLKRLLQLRPYAGGLQWELARVYALMDDKTGAYDTLINLQKAGYNFDPSGDKDFKNIEGTGVYAYVIKNLKENSKPYGKGAPAFTLQNDTPMIESFTYDEKGKRFFAASARTGEIFSVDATGKTTPFIKPSAENGLSGVFALAVDAKNNRLYVSSTHLRSFDHFQQARYGQGGLYQFELSSGKFLKQFGVPADGMPHLYSALTVASSGEVYAADAAARAVFQLRGDAFRQLFQSEQLGALRGIAVSADHKFLYLSDFETGLYLADLEKNEIRALELRGQNLGGIDGLYVWRDTLICLQNGFSPARVIRVALNKDQRSLRLVQPLEASKPKMIVPTFGAMVGDVVYFIANSQRDLYNQNGEIGAGEKPERRVIYQADVKFTYGQELKLPDWATKKK
jgi:sugar lactone lactonase YvrE